MERIIFETDIMTEFQLENAGETKVRAVILCLNKIKKFIDADIMGRSCLDYVKTSLCDYDTVILDTNETQNVAETVQKYVKDEDFLVVIYGDTPLLSQATIRDAVDYAITKNLDFCKLPRGYIFKTSALVSGNIEVSAEANFLDKDEFFSVFNFETLAFARKVMKKKIIERHLRSGVEFFDTDSVYIEDTVEIGKNVKIFYGNVLKGKTVIGAFTTLFENNLIENCVVGENCEICGAVLYNEKLKNNTIIKPNCNIKGENK